MDEIICICERLERLEGMSARIFITQFLDETGVDEKDGKTYYACKVCGRPWTQEIVEGQPVLTRMETEFNV
jgi:hypothetical protein